LWHSSAEELARYIWDELATALRSRGALTDVTTMEISVAERPGTVGRITATRPATETFAFSS